MIGDLVANQMPVDFDCRFNDTKVSQLRTSSGYLFHSLVPL